MIGSCLFLNWSVCNCHRVFTSTQSEIFEKLLIHKPCRRAKQCWLQRAQSLPAPSYTTLVPFIVQVHRPIHANLSLMEVDDVELDPPIELVDSCSCLPSSTVNSRCNSIGTLTSWQLLAKQVQSQPESQEAPTSRKKPPALLELECTPRSASWTSGVARIAPRPHHAFYQQYRLLEIIGKGAFGTVSIAVRRADGSRWCSKEIAMAGQAALASAKQRDAIMEEVGAEQLAAADSTPPCSPVAEPVAAINACTRGHCPAGECAGQDEAPQHCPLLRLFHRRQLSDHHHGILQCRGPVWAHQAPGGQAAS